MTNYCLHLISLLLVFGFTQSNPVESSPKPLNENPAPEVATDVTAAGNEPEIPDSQWTFENKKNDTRRILFSKSVEKGKRPYMVYLHLTKESAKSHGYKGWLCGGVIVHKSYVLTSAACVEDADKFYIVSGTTKFVDSLDYKSNECVCNNRRKVVWKCIPKNYKFDFQDTLKWSSNDIAIVKVEKPFKFGVIEKGCEFATQRILYNNISRELEKTGTKGFIAGWGTGSTFREGIYRRAEDTPEPVNAKCLQEAKVCIMDNKQCAKRWAEKFRPIITEYMICTKDVMKQLSEICDKKYANCKDVDVRRLSGDNSTISASSVSSGKIFNIDLGRHLKDPNDYTARRADRGGFCENDHGGPLVVQYKGKERAIGIISACKIDPKTHSCHGPFLYTSIFKNRQFLSCAINKDIEAETGESGCRRVFRSGITHEEWTVDWTGYKEDSEKFLRSRAEEGDDEHKSKNSTSAVIAKEAGSEKDKADKVDVTKEKQPEAKAPAAEESKGESKKESESTTKKDTKKKER